MAACLYGWVESIRKRARASSAQPDRSSIVRNACHAARASSFWPMVSRARARLNIASGISRSISSARFAVANALEGMPGVGIKEKVGLGAAILAGIAIIPPIIEALHIPQLVEAWRG